MKICFLLLMTFFSCILLEAQQSAGGLSMRGNFANEISVSDVNGRPFEAKYADVTGHPFLKSEFKYAAIELVGGQKYAHVNMRINICTDEINFITADQKEFYIGPGVVKRIVFTDSLQKGYPVYTFCNGYPASGAEKATSFYQVMAEGKCTLLKSVSKVIVTRKNDMSGEVSKEFETYENYYLFINGNMKRINKDKESILQVLSDRQPQIRSFMTDNKINIKNETQLVKLIVYYNSLY